MDASLLLGNWYSAGASVRVRFTSAGTMHSRHYPYGYPSQRLVASVYSSYRLEGSNIVMTSGATSYRSKEGKKKMNHPSKPDGSRYHIAETTPDHIYFDETSFITNTGERKMMRPFKLFRSLEEAKASSPA